MIVSSGIEIRSDILAKHKPVYDFSVRGIIVISVYIVSLHFDVSSVWLLVFVPGWNIRVVVVLFTRSLIVLKEIHRLCGFRMVASVVWGSFCDSWPVCEYVAGRIRDCFAL